MKHSSDLGSISLYLVVFALVAIGISLYWFCPLYVGVKDEIYKTSCEDTKAKIAEAVADYIAENGAQNLKKGCEIDLEILRSKGYLKDYQPCPEGGKYMLGEKLEVICTTHDSGENK